MATIAVRCGTVFDGSTWVEERDLVVLDGVISDATHTAEVNRTIDARDRWVVPALTDAHCHLLPSQLLRLPAFGVGYAVDMFSTPGMRSTLDRDALSAGIGYTTAGIGAAVRGGHPYQLVDSGLYQDFSSVEEAGGPAAFVEQASASGVGFLKVFVEDGRFAGVDLPALDLATVRALVEEAHRRRLLVIAHATTADLAIEAIVAGVDGLAHAPIPTSNADIDEFVACASAAGTFVVSTLVATASALGIPQTGSMPDSPIWRRVPEAWRTHLQKAGSSRIDRVAFDRALSLVAAAHAASIPIYPGTDAAFPGVMPGLSLHIELELLARCGIPASTLLDSATTGMRNRLGNLHGGVRPSLRAEILVLSQDPRKLISATTMIEWAIFGEQAYRLASD